MAFVPTANEKCRWCVKDTSHSPWRDLPGMYTTAEIWQMRIEGLFAAAILSDETPPKEVTSDDWQGKIAREDVMLGSRPPKDSKE